MKKQRIILELTQEQLELLLEVLAIAALKRSLVGLHDDSKRIDLIENIIRNQVQRKNDK